MIFLPWCGRRTEPPSNATLLLHFEGADGETNIVDSSVHAWTMTGHDACKISTAQAKWGGSSLLVSRTGGMKGLAAISASSVLAHGIDEPWWVDYWVYPVAIASSQLHRVFRFIGVSGPENASTLLKTGGLLYSFMSWNIGDEGGPPYPPVIAMNTWTHIAVCYDGTTQRRFVNGVLAASTVRSSLSVASSSGSVEIGGAVTSTGTTPDGSTEIYIDELRFLLGSCPYTSDFTPPTGPY